MFLEEFAKESLCRLSVPLSLQQDIQYVRLRIHSPPQIILQFLDRHVGEIAFYTKSPYGTSAVADQSSQLYRLGVSELQSMQQSNPKAAAAFSEFALSLFANHLTYANNKIANLLFLQHNPLLQHNLTLWSMTNVTV